MPTSAVTGTKQMRSAGKSMAHTDKEKQGANGIGFLRQRTSTIEGQQVVEELHGKVWVIVRDL